MEIKKIAILTNIIPHYRQDFYDRIFAIENIHVTVFCQKKLPGSNVNSIHQHYPSNAILIKYFAPFGNEKLVFQFYPFFRILKNYDLIVADGNLRHILQALYTTLFRIFRKKVIIWSNVYSVQRNPLQKIRIFWWRYFKNFLMYTEKDKELLIHNKFHNKIIESINNGLNQTSTDLLKSHWGSEKLKKFKNSRNIASNSIVISSGRVNTFNQHIIALQAMKIVKESIPDILWIVVGEGAELNNLKRKVSEYSLAQNVLFLGAIYSEVEKCPWFMISDIFVHPGPIGLSILNAFGYSLPVITHSNFTEHGPEFSLFVENETGITFEYTNHRKLARAIVHLLKNRTSINKMRESCSAIAAQYNTKVMSERFYKIIQKVI